MKKKNINKNYLKNVPCRSDKLQWKTEEDGKVTLIIENKGIFNRVFQIILKKPKQSFIHLDEMGSFVWQIIDDKQSISKLALQVEKKFGEASHPLYERLAQFFKIMKSYGFISFKEEE